MNSLPGRFGEGILLDDIVGLIFIAILIGLTAFFVISEFAIVKVRVSRIEQLVEEGNKKAVAAKKIIDNLDETVILFLIELK